MVGWLDTPKKGAWWSHLEPVNGPRGLPLLRLTMPERGDRARLLHKGAKRLQRAGAQRLLLSRSWAGAGSTVSGRVDPLPLCRALALEMGEALLKEIPLRERRVILRGTGSEAALLRCARGLCPQCGQLILEVRSGGKRLAEQLWQSYGAAVLLGEQRERERQAQLLIAFTPGRSRAQRELKLYERPELSGVKLACPGVALEGVESLDMLELLWECGRMRKEEVEITVEKP